ncbi:hypothetical protein [Erysipelothrix rhusiopathiae]|nr:hypothetical protein [Erysipelothrix rhusiopathiae]MDE8287710.1 hypothetical protein [Erysipelothrix rhusiopathiae]QDE02426.1 hypothetical protein AB984_00632 [Erysipelothrix rhusiopathiae]QDE04107.1 hypothetical protein AB985_00638 [Erysipelothrix rhusiopathiae]BAK31657.1 hypothetical protein ERH_0600 [Erysipelothrix rhusiopathiae str. Fujisawa]
MIDNLWLFLKASVLMLGIAIVWAIIFSVIREVIIQNNDEPDRK